MASIGKAAQWLEEGRVVRRRAWKGDCVLTTNEHGIVVARAGRPPAFDSKWLTADQDVLETDWEEVE